MFALRVEYQTGRSVSQRYNDRTSAEWPPHPARLFFALASAYFETGEDGDEGRFLEWLEAQDPPAMYATEAEHREVTFHYVPVNDARVLSQRADGEAALPSLEELSVLPEYRRRKERTFPAAIPREPAVYFVWPHTEPPASLLEAAERLCGKVAYLGHSSSLVCVRPAVSFPPPNWVPVPEGQGELVLRVCFEGQLEALRRTFERYRSSGVRGTLPAVLQAYRRVASAATQYRPVVPSVFGSMVVFRRQVGPTLPLTGMPLAVAALRRAALSLCAQPVPEVLSGHAPDGSPSERPHVAFLALPDVGHRHADGHLAGVAAVLPRNLSLEERYTVFRALASVTHLALGAAGAWSVLRVGGAPALRALDERTWQGPARRWASVTPILLDRYPKRLFGPEAEAIIAGSCERVGLPRPTHVLVAPYSILKGVAPTFAFVSARDATERRPMVHAVLEFGQPVEGPVLLGAGRYRGWGLLRPLPWDGSS